MTITFGHHLDGTPWSGGAASAGELRTGPVGLRRLLETRLGLGGPEAHPADRIGAWRDRMAAIDHEKAWFHASFEADPWSTAKTLLAWRDELVEAGWTRTHQTNAAGTKSAAPGASDRLAALAEIESRDEPALPSGHGDRLHAVLSELSDIESGTTRARGESPSQRGSETHGHGQAHRGGQAHAGSQRQGGSDTYGEGETHGGSSQPHAGRPPQDRTSSLRTTDGEPVGPRVLDISRIVVLDDWSHIPPVWRRLFDTLERLGVRVDRDAAVYPIRRTPGEAESGAGASSESVRAAGTPTSEPSATLDCHLLEADDEWEAAEAVATWLAADEEAPPTNAGADAAASPNAGVTLVCRSETAVLDAALRSRGLPAVGAASRSPWRGALQVLPLVFANAWRPVDVHRLIELLALDYSPVPRAVARPLTDALCEEPGVGGMAWNEALETATGRLRERFAEAGERDPAAKAEERIAEVRSYLAEARYDPEEGIPGEEAVARCEWVIERLGREVDRDATAAAAVTHAQVLSRLCRDRERIARRTLERVIDSVVAHGMLPGDVAAEAAPWTVVSHPGQVVDPCDTVIWWNFTNPGAPGGTHWTRTERAALSAAGVELPAAESAHLREARAWSRVAEAARHRLVLVMPKLLAGEATQHHPWLDELPQPTTGDDGSEPAADSTPRGRSTGAADRINLTRTAARTLFTSPEFSFADRRTALDQVRLRTEREPDGAYTVPPGAIPERDGFSYSSMNALIGCPMHWALSKHAGLEPRGAPSVPEGNQMLGTLCHRIVERLFSQGGQPPRLAEAESRAGALFDELVESMASRLLLPGREVERRRARTTIARAVRRLVETLARTGLTVESVEEQLEAQVDGLTARGWADVIARDRAGRPFVIDMKWSSSSRYHREEIERGEPLQLAVYSCIAGAAASQPAASQPAASQPAASQPAASQPAASGAAESRAAASGAAASQAAASQAPASDAAASRTSPSGAPASGADASAAAGAGYFMLTQGAFLTTSRLAGDEAIESTFDPEEILERGLRTWRARLEAIDHGTLEATGVTEARRRERDEISGEELENELRKQYRERGHLYRNPPCRFCDFAWLCGLEGEQR